MLTHRQDIELPLSPPTCVVSQRSPKNRFVHHFDLWPSRPSMVYQVKNPLSLGSTKLSLSFAKEEDIPLSWSRAKHPEISYIRDIEASILAYTDEHDETYDGTGTKIGHIKGHIVQTARIMNEGQNLW